MVYSSVLLPRGQEGPTLHDINYGVNGERDAGAPGDRRIFGGNAADV